MKHSHIVQDILLTVSGIAAPILGLIASWQEQLEYGLRITSLLVGIGVGVLTCCSLLAKMRRAEREAKTAADEAEDAG